MLHDLPAPVYKLIVERMHEHPDGKHRFMANVLISGNSGTGKTTLANMLAHHIREDRRIAYLHAPGEESDIDPTARQIFNMRMRDRKGPHRTDLIRNALRMRMDWIVLDEVRDAAASMQIQAGLSGHNTLSTIHAPNPAEALERLTNLAMLDVNDHRLTVKRIKESDYLIIQVHRGPQGYQIVEVAQALKDPLAPENDLTLVSGGNVKDPNLAYHLNTLYQR